MADLNELRAELATVEGNLAHERQNAEAERCLAAADIDPGVFAGAGSRVRVLEKRERELGVAIGNAEADKAAQAFVSSYREWRRIAEVVEPEIDDLEERAQAELAAARSDGHEAIDYKRRYDLPNGFADLGYTGWDHKTPGPGIMPIPDEIREQLRRIDAAEQNLATIRARRVSEVLIPRQNLAQQYPQLHSVKFNLALEKA